MRQHDKFSVKNMNRFFYLILTGLLFQSIGPAEETTVLPLVNPGFEEGLKGWRVNELMEKMTKLLPEAAREGSFGLRVDDASPIYGSSTANIPLPVKPGKKYRISFWAKNQSTAKGKVNLTFRFYKEDGKILDMLPDEQEKYNQLGIAVPKSGMDDGEWHSYSIEATPPAAAVTFSVWLHSWSKTTCIVDFDDFKFEEFAPPAK